MHHRDSWCLSSANGNLLASCFLMGIWYNTICPGAKGWADFNAYLILEYCAKNLRKGLGSQISVWQCGPSTFQSSCPRSFCQTFPKFWVQEMEMELVTFPTHCNQNQLQLITQSKFLFRFAGDGFSVRNIQFITSNLTTLQRLSRWHAKL